MIAIIATIREEMAALLQTGAFHQVEGPAQGLAFSGSAPTAAGGAEDVFVLLSGMGRTRAQEGTSWLVRQQAPAAIISIGFAGATQPGLPTGTVLLGTSLAHLEGPPIEWDPSALGQRFYSTPTLLSRARQAVEVGGIDFRQGPLITAPILAKSPGLKRWLGARVDAIGVDLESYWVALSAHVAGVPFMAVRVILDRSDMLLPDVVSEIPNTPDGGRVRPILKHIARNPRRLVGLAQLGQASHLASGQIREFLFAYLSAPDSESNPATRSDAA